MGGSMWDKIKKEFELANEFFRWLYHSNLGFSDFKSEFLRSSKLDKYKMLLYDSGVNFIGLLITPLYLLADVLVTPIRLIAYPFKEFIKCVKKQRRKDDIKHRVYKFITKNPLFGVVGIVDKGLTIPVAAVGFVNKTIIAPVTSIFLTKHLKGKTNNDREY